MFRKLSIFIVRNTTRSYNAVSSCFSRSSVVWLRLGLKEINIRLLH